MFHIRVTAQAIMCRVTTALWFVVSGYSMSDSNSLRPPNWRGLALLAASIPRSPAAHLALALVAGRFHREAIHLANLAKDLILKKKRRALWGFNKLEPSMKQSDKHQRNCVAREEGVKKEKAAKPSSFSEIVRVHYVDLAACETEALVKPAHPIMLL